MIGDCANCKSHICAGRGISCKKINQDEVLDLYTDEEKKIMKAAAFVEATYYSELTRLEETVEFAKPNTGLRQDLFGTGFGGNCRICQTNGL